MEKVWAGRCDKEDNREARYLSAFCQRIELRSIYYALMQSC